jgi:2-phosphoglycerate kinase
MNAKLQMVFTQAYILGGSPCSGKSTIAQSIADRFGFQYYKADDHDHDYMLRCDPDRQPVMLKYSQMNWSEIWMQSVETLVNDEFAYYRENFPLILEDLQKMDGSKPILLEGVAFLPELVAGYALNKKRVLYLVPTRKFQITHYSQRPWIKKIFESCDDPDLAFSNWMTRDEHFGREVLSQTRKYNFRSIEVDGFLSILEQIVQVCKYFGLE